MTISFETAVQDRYARGAAVVAPRLPVDPQSTAPFDCARPALRHPRETKGEDYDATTGASALRCAPDGCC